MKSQIIIEILGGALFIVCGIKITVSGTFWGIPNTRIPGVLFIPVGLYFIYAAIKKKSSLFPQYLKCTSCGQVQTKIGSINKCIKCGNEMENLVGFYDRHPENKAQQKNSADPKNRAAD